MIATYNSILICSTSVVASIYVYVNIFAEGFTVHYFYGLLMSQQMRIEYVIYLPKESH